MFFLYYFGSVCSSVIWETVCIIVSLLVDLKARNFNKKVPLVDSVNQSKVFF